MWNINNKSEVACSLVSIILEENKVQFTNENFEKIFKVTNLKIETYWYSWFFTKVLKKTDNGLYESEDPKPILYEKNNQINNEENAQTIKEESEEDMGFGLFD